MIDFGASITWPQGSGTSTRPALDLWGPDLAKGPRSRALVGLLDLENAESLREDLSLPKERSTQAQLLLTALQRWGVDTTLDRLRGHFAFVYWDGTRAVAARDVFGTLPLYYTQRGKALRFTSHIATLLPQDQAPRLNEARIGEFLARDAGDPRETFFADIFRVPAAHVLVATETQTPRLARYWGDGSFEEPRSLRSQEIGERLVVRTRELVTWHLGARQDAALSLSGGLDSTAIAAIAHADLRGEDRLDALTLTFPEHPSCDEHAAVTAFAQHLPRLDVIPIRGDAIGPYDDLSLLQFPEGPEAFPHFTNLIALLKAAKVRGRARLLTGLDGDTLFASSTVPTLATSLSEGHVLSVSRELSHLRTRYGSRTPAVLAAIFKHALLSKIPGGTKCLTRVSTRDSVQEDLALVRSRFVKTASLVERLTRRRVYRGNVHSVHRAALLTTAFHANAHESNHALRRLTGVDSRHVYYDRDLAEIAMTIPSHLRRRHGFGRFIQRQAFAPLRGQTPSWDKRKVIYNQFVDDMLCSRQETELYRSLFNGDKKITRYIDIARARRAYDALRTGDTSQRNNLWAASSLSIWLERISNAPKKEEGDQNV